ncbi:hypothetical protein NQ314_011857 [Rhamnusium bicolor]|uniref:Uncharacterized protein n=1 Tax=Rhamnusium bicolor TaxID=1586634 RepID=A0AAV8XFP9_9CUCU|nr:hypothetical protein NQ314_011857 [Rhamnusium bicolor]
MLQSGCVNFGHSCYGGMGKRASDLIDTNEEVLQNFQEEENPAFVFTGPRSSYKPKPSQRLTQQQYDNNISRVIRQWVSYGDT